MDITRYKKCYLNTTTGQAIHVVCRDETMTWGKVNVIEAVTPKVGVMLMPQKLDRDWTGWVEITPEAFNKLLAKYVDEMRNEKKPKKEGVISWLRGLGKKK